MISKRIAFALTDSRRAVDGRSRVDSQVEGDDAVAVMLGLEIVGKIIGARRVGLGGRKGDAMVVVAASLTDGFVERKAIVRIHIDGDGRGRGTHAAIRSRYRVGGGRGGGNRNGGGGGTRAPKVGFSAARSDGGRFALTERSGGCGDGEYGVRVNDQLAGGGVSIGGAVPNLHSYQ